MQNEFRLVISSKSVNEGFARVVVSAFAAPLDPTLEELAKLSGVEVSEVVEALNVSFPPISLTCSEDEKGGQFDIPTPSPDEEITNELSVRQLLMRLEPKDRKLIYLRYFKNLTQVQTAEILGMKQVQVSRREKKLLGIMRKMLEEF